MNAYVEYYIVIVVCKYSFDNCIPPIAIKVRVFV